MTELDEWEREVLRCAAGLPSKVEAWGAAVSAAMGPLTRLGYMTADGRITPAGRAALKEAEG